MRSNACSRWWYLLLASFDMATKNTVPLGPWVAVDHRGVGDADLRRDLAAAMIVAGGLIRSQSAYFPELRARVGVERIGASVFGNYDQHIMRLPRHRKAAHVERLPVDFAVHRQFTKLAKPVEVDILRGEHRLRSIPSVARVVIVIRGYIHARGGSHRKSQGGGMGERTGGAGKDDVGTPRLGAVARRKRDALRRARGERKRGWVGRHPGGQSAQRNAGGPGEAVERSRRQLHRLPRPANGQAQRLRADRQRKVRLAPAVERSR